MSRAAKRSVARSAPAKINLTLDVLGLRPDGYHEIASVMHTISLADKITISQGPEGAGILLSVTGPEAEDVPTDENNLVWRAVQAFGAHDLSIHVEKHIPSQAGLGGGSSDAAATLTALNQLASGKLSRDQLVEMGASLGADIPFFLHGGIARVEGIGERVSPVPHFPGFSMVVVKPPVGVPTADAYRLLDEVLNRKSAQATSRWPNTVFSNDFEAVIFARLPEIAAARDALREAGAKPVLLCGSGAGVFGVTDKPELVAERVERAKVGHVYIAETISRRAG